MSVEEALSILYTVLKLKRLTDVQEFVFCETWRGKTYVEMAENSGYEADYIKFVGFQLWQLLSQAFGEKVNKSNLHSVLKRKAQQLSELPVLLEITNINTSSQQPIQTRTDWGEAIDVSVFYGRTPELATLEQWIVSDRCRLVALLGIGGIGKTALSVRIAEQIQTSFDYVIWRSLRNAPPIQDILADIIQFLSNHEETHLPETIDGGISQLIDYLRSSRCLLVLDNFETVLQSGEYTGIYRKGFQGYGQLLRRVGEERHQSCLLITSRERPEGVALLEAETLPLRLLKLPGLREPAAQEMIKAKGLVGTEEERRKLIHCYTGNPLALKIASTSIQYLFESNISKFLEQSTTVFKSINVVLEQQFNRLSDIEKDIMYWLAINREPVSPTELQNDIVPLVSHQKLLAALESLRWRSLIEQTPDGFTQQPVVMEYVTEQLIEQVWQEIATENIQILMSHALLKAQANEYMRQSQRGAILEPLVERLSKNFSSKKEIEYKLNHLVFKLREEFATPPGYGCRNVINLFSQLGSI